MDLLGRTTRTRSYGVVLCLCALIIAHPLEPGNAERDPASLDAAVKRNTRFGFDLLRALEQDRTNVFVSPFSVSSALAPIYAGARGDTARQFAKILRFPERGFELHGIYRRLLDTVHGSAAGEDAVLRTVTGMWVQTGKDLLPEFERIASDDYKLRIERADFRNRANSIVEDINAWVARETNDKIQNLMSRDGIDALTRLVLANAIYFKGRWKNRFDPQQTSMQDFWIGERQAVRVPTMSQQNRFSMYKNDLLTLVRLPYSGEHLSMSLLLPQRHADMRELMKTLTPEALAAWEAQAKQTELLLHMPRFRISSNIDLASVLNGMGLVAPFGATADFSGIDGTRELYISGARHQAFVEVDEEGSEAAAATGVAIGMRSVVPLPVVDFNRPFLFLIREHASGTVLFLGRLNNPLA